MALAVSASAQLPSDFSVVLTGKVLQAVSVRLGRSTRGGEIPGAILPYSCLADFAMHYCRGLGI